MKTAFIFIKPFHIPAFLVILFLLSSLFTPVSFGVLSINSTDYFWGHGDLFAHFLLFNLSAWLVLVFRLHHFLWLLLVIVGVFSEVVQALWLVDRQGSVSDALVNVIGVLLVVVHSYIRKRRIINRNAGKR